MPAGDDLSLFHDALKATLIANGVLGKVRAELKVAALEAVRRQPPHDDEMDAPGAVGAHSVDTTDDAQALAHALVLDFLKSQSTLSRSASVFESEAGVERLNSGLRSREGLERAAGVAGSSPNEPLLVSLLRRPGGLGGGGSGSQATSQASSPTRMPLKRQARPVIAPAAADDDHDDDDGGYGDDAREEETTASTPADSAASSNLSSPERASGAGPSFSVAKAARWPAGNRTGGISREASIEFSDATADASVEEGIDWDYVQGEEGGARSSTSGGVSSFSAAAKPAAASHSDPFSAAAAAAPVAAVVAPASSMVPPEDTDSDEDGSGHEDAAPASGGAAVMMQTGDSDDDDDDNDAADDMYGGFEDDDDEF